MAANKTYPCLTADKVAVLMPHGAMLAVSGFTPTLLEMAYLPIWPGMLMETILRISNVESFLTQWRKI